MNALYQKLQIHSAHSIISSDNDYENDPAIFSGLFLGNSKNQTQQNSPFSKSAFSNTLANLEASISQPSINGSQSVILHIDEIKKRQIDKSPVIFEDSTNEASEEIKMESNVLRNEQRAVSRGASRDASRDLSRHEPRNESSIANSPEIPKTIKNQEVPPKLFEKTEYQC